MIYTIKLCNKTIHNVRSDFLFVCVQTIYCIKDTIYCFLMTYLLLNAINFTRSGICLSEVGIPQEAATTYPLQRQWCMHGNGKLQKPTLRTHHMDIKYFLVVNGLNAIWCTSKESIPQSTWPTTSRKHSTGLISLARQISLRSFPPMHSPVYHKIAGAYMDQSVAIERFVHN